MELIKEKLPVSISLGIWMTLLTYLISIPLGIRKAVQRRLALRHLDLGASSSSATPSRASCSRSCCIILFAGGSFFDMFPLRGLTSDNWAQLSLVRQDHRLFLAPHAAADRDGARRLHHHDVPDQELVPRRDPQAVRDDRARQGLHRAAGALRPRLPQRHADRHRRLPRRLHPRLLLRLAADRDDLLARRARPARLRERDQPRLSGRVRHAVHLLADRPRGAIWSPTSSTRWSIRASISRRGRSDDA